MREAEESGHRQVEERIRRQEDEIFRQVGGGWGSGCMGGCMGGGWGSGCRGGEWGSGCIVNGNVISKPTVCT